MVRLAAGLLAQSLCSNRWSALRWDFAPRASTPYTGTYLGRRCALPSPQPGTRTDPSCTQQQQQQLTSPLLTNIPTQKPKPPKKNKKNKEDVLRLEYRTSTRIFTEEVEFKTQLINSPDVVEEDEEEEEDGSRSRARWSS
jgi:hypothetical protein